MTDTQAVNVLVWIGLLAYGLILGTLGNIWSELHDIKKILKEQKK